MGYILHVGSVIVCPHGGQVTISSSNTKVSVSGQKVATVQDTFTITGCAFILVNSPHPCSLIKWVSTSNRVKINGQPVILQDNTGLCQAADQMVQGSAIVSQMQMKVKGL